MTIPVGWFSITVGVLGLVVGVVGVGIGVLGFGLGIYQTRAMRKQSELHKEKCSIRYRDISETVSNLTEHIIVACEIVKSDCIGKSRQCSALSANINSAMSLSRELIRFCNRLDEEYKAEFHDSVDKKTAAHLENIRCRCIDVPRYNPLEPCQDSVQDALAQPASI